MAATPPDYLRANVEAWEARQADQLRVARRQWSRTEPVWGVFGIPEQVARVLPASLDGTTAVELGCGTAYVSAWLACRGAQPVGIPANDRLLRAHFGMHRFEWSDDPTVEFHLSHGDWIRLLRANHLEIEDLQELCPPADATTNALYPFVTAEWARRWPAEEIWRAKRR